MSFNYFTFLNYWVS